MAGILSVKEGGSECKENLEKVKAGTAGSRVDHWMAKSRSSKED